MLLHHYRCDTIHEGTRTMGKIAAFKLPALLQRGSKKIIINFLSSDGMTGAKRVIVFHFHFSLYMSIINAHFGRCSRCTSLPSSVVNHCRKIWVAVKHVNICRLQFPFLVINIEGLVDAINEFVHFNTLLSLGQACILIHVIKAMIYSSQEVREQYHHLML